MDLGVAINDFSNSLSALREFAQQIGSFLRERAEDQYKKHAEDLGAFLLAVEGSHPDLKIPDEMRERLSLRFGKVEMAKDPGDGSVRVTFEKEESGERFLNAVRVVAARSTQTSLLYCSSLISLISAAEWYLSRLIQAFFEKFPEAAKPQDKMFSLDDLKAFDTIADAQRHLIEMRVSDVMWGSLDDWVQFLKTRMHLSMGYLDPHLDEITEIFQRRNVVAHNNGVVHHSYIAKVAPQFREKVSVGKKLPVSPGYLLNALDLIELNFTLIGTELWKQFDPGDCGRGELLTDLAFSALVAERWPVAEGMSLFLMNDKALPESNQLRGRLNYWQSLKWQGRFEEIRDDVKKADFSAKGELFQLARAALLGEAEPFFDLLPSVLESKSLGYKQLESWPIFREIRQGMEYQKFHEEHRGDFEAAREKYDQAEERELKPDGKSRGSSDADKEAGSEGASAAYERRPE